MSKFRARIRSDGTGVTLTLRPIEDAGNGKFPFDAFDQRRSTFEPLTASQFFELATEVRQHHGAHVAAAALETVRRLAQRLGLASSAGLLQHAQALLGVVQD